MYYKHSGRFSVGGVALGSALGCAAAIILGYIYGRGSILIDDERFAFLITIAFGAFTGLCAGYGMVLGKVRNQNLNLVVQACTAVIALYVSWAAWVVDIVRHYQVETAGWIEYAKNPGVLWRAVCYINQYGTWSLGKGDATKGAALWAVWIVEAAMVIGLAMTIGYEVLRYHAFCDRCELWCRRGAKLTLSVPPNTALLKRQLESNDWRSFESLNSGNKNASHLEVELDSCDQCRQLNTLSLTYVSITRDKLRRVRTSKDNIVRHLLISAAQAENLKQLSTKVELAAKLAPPKISAANVGKK